MIGPTSRYAGLQVRVLEAADSAPTPYLSRRFVPAATSLPLLQEVAVAQDDRLDLITARTLGDPEQFWRICDANDAMNPTALLAPVGRRLRVPVPYPRQAGLSLPLSLDVALPPAGNS
jgi:hypothetical protein